MSVQVFSHPSKKVLITGKSGTGKTTLLEKLLKKEKARWKFVFDHQGEFSARFGAVPCHSANDLCEAVERGGWVVFDPVKEWPGRTEEAFRFFCDFAFCMAETQKGRKLFICDELQKLIDPNKLCPELLCILDTGRRYQLDFFAICQAPNTIHNSVRNQITEIYTFRQSDGNAIKFLSENSFNEEQVRNLKGFDHLWRNLSTGDDNFGGAVARSDNEGGANSRASGERGKLENGGV